MAISMTKLSSADYYLDRTREALQADGAIPDEATPGPLTGPDPAAYYNAEGNPPGRWIGSASRLLGGETGRQLRYTAIDFDSHSLTDRCR